MSLGGDSVDPPVGLIAKRQDALPFWPPRAPVEIKKGVGVQNNCAAPAS